MSQKDEDGIYNSNSNSKFVNLKDLQKIDENKYKLFDKIRLE